MGLVVRFAGILALGLAGCRTAETHAVGRTDGRAGVVTGPLTSAPAADPLTTLRLAIRWPGGSPREQQALPSSTRLLRLRVLGGGKVLSEQWLSRPVSGEVQNVDLRFARVGRVTVEALAYREETAELALEAVPIARGRMADVMLASSKVVSVRLSLESTLAPRILDASAQWGHPGDPIWLTGEHFAIGSFVEFGGGATASLDLRAPDRGVVRIPAEAEPGLIRVWGDGVPGPRSAYVWVLPPDVYGLARLQVRAMADRKGWDPSGADSLSRTVMTGESLRLETEVAAFRSPTDALPWATRSLDADWNVTTPLGRFTERDLFTAAQATGRTRLEWNVGEFGHGGLDVEVATLSMRILMPKAAWDPRPAHTRLLLAGSTRGLALERYLTVGEATRSFAAGQQVSWSLEPAWLAWVTQEGVLYASYAMAKGEVRASVGGYSAPPQAIEVAGLDFSVATSSMVFDPNFGDAPGIRQLGAQLRLSSGEDLSAYMRYESDEPSVCSVSATGDVRVLAFSSDRTVQVRVINVLDGRASLIPVVIKRKVTDAAEISAGTFQMGSPTSEFGRSSNETQHQVTLIRDFWMQRTEVTQGQWRRLMNDNPSAILGDDNRPVEQVSWYDAVAYANALSAKDGLAKAYNLSNCSGTPGRGNYSCSTVTPTASTPYATVGWRLPTEAEWEYAYRAGTTTAWYFGSDSNLLGTYAWFSGSGYTTGLVGQRLPNAWGLYDMAGNIWEWCQDWYGSYPDALTDPVGPTSGSYRVLRGGSWNSVESSTRAAFRSLSDPGHRFNNIGFRLSRSRP